MISPGQAIALGLLQGSTELFPVSSLGHAVTVPRLAHWNINQTDPTFLPFLVLLHLGTAGALLFLYRREWGVIIAAFVRTAVRGKILNETERLAMLLVVGSVPAALAGALGESALKKLFADPRAAAGFLVANGFMLLSAEMLRRRRERQAKIETRTRVEQELAFRDIGSLSFRNAFLIGIAQAFALLPGISRSGITMAGGLVAGLRHEEAARFSFLLATPIILGAGLIEIPSLFTKGAPFGSYLLGAVLAGVAAYLSARFLLRYFKSGRLDPYGAYCVGFGALGLALLH